MTKSIFGMEPETVIGRMAADVFDDPLAHIIRDALAGRMTDTHEVIIKRKGGGRTILDVSTSQLKSRDGTVLGAVLIATDLTEAKKTEEWMRRIDRLSSLGQLSAGVAHEMRNPLASMNFNIQLLSKRIQADEKTRRIIDNSLAGVERIKGLVKGMLDFSRPAPPQLKKEFIHRAVEDAVALMDSQFAKHGIRVGGDGDGWERGPYWIDGLVPLAYILKDETLIAKARPWIEWVLANQEPSGYIGPKRFDREPPVEPGIQKTSREDWWPRIVMLMVLQQHYSATGDQRVVQAMRRYFRYQLSELCKTPLDHWTFWANRRGGDNLMVVYWLYNLTGEAFLLDLAEIIHQQTFPWTDVFLNTNPAPSPDLAHLYPYNTGNRYPFKLDLIRRLSVDQLQSFHCVNLAQTLRLLPGTGDKRVQHPGSRKTHSRCLASILLSRVPGRGEYLHPNRSYF